MTRNAANDVREALRQAAEEEADAIEREAASRYLSEDDERDEISAADALIAEVRGTEDATVNVYRVGSGKGKEAFLFSYPADDVVARDIMERCQDEFDGGNFKMVIRDAEKIVRSARFSVEVPKERPQIEKKDGLGTMELLTIMQGQQNQMMQMFQTTMTSFAEAFKGGRDNQTSIKDIVESVAAMHALAPQAPKDDGSKYVEMLIQGMSLANEFGNRGDTNTNDILLKALDYLPGLADVGKQIQTMQSARNASGRPPQSQPQTPNDPEVAESVQREHEQGRQKAMWAMNVNMLLQWAKQGRDPSLYAELIIDQVGEEKVIEFIHRPDALEFLASFNGEVMTYRHWFEALKNELIATLTDDDDSANTDGAAGTVIEGQSSAISDADDTGNTGGAPRGNGGRS